LKELSPGEFEQCWVRRKANADATESLTEKTEKAEKKKLKRA